jgi:hypothetical protein
VGAVGGNMRWRARRLRSDAAPVRAAFGHPFGSLVSSDNLQNRGGGRRPTCGGWLQCGRVFDAITLLQRTLF